MGAEYFQQYWFIKLNKHKEVFLKKKKKWSPAEIEPSSIYAQMIVKCFSKEMKNGKFIVSQILTK